MAKYVLAIDQGTTSSRTIIFAHDGSIKGIAQQEFTQIFPQPGWVEHDPEEIWTTQQATMQKALADTNLTANDIAAIGITNQRETVVVWNRETGKPICNAIVWQDRRTADFCDELKSKGLEKTIQEKTGLVIDAYFSGTKIKWILDHVEGARQLANDGKLCFGTIDCWLLWKLTDGEVHLTDVSNASRTMLCNIATCQWDPDLQELLDVPASMLPEIRSNSEVYCQTTALDGQTSVPVAGIAGDQQAALFGQLCTQPGMVKNTYGTGCFMLMNTGTEMTPSKNNLLTTVAWQIDGVTSYALEGSVFIGGAVVQWLRDGLGIIETSSDVEELAKKVDTTDGVYVVPAFAGLGAPYWNQHARGVITGLTRGSNRSHIARASLEAIAYQTMDVLKAMEADSDISIKQLRVDGGATENDLMMQFQSDLLDTDVVRPTITETTALGAAYLAGLAVGFWPSIDALRDQWQVQKTFSPAIEEADRDRLIEGWHEAIKASLANA